MLLPIPATHLFNKGIRFTINQLNVFIIKHFLISFVVAGVFILSAERISLLRRNIILSSLLYGVGIFVVLYVLILPLSAAPLVPLQTMDVIELIIEHVLVIGLPLGLFVRRSMKTNR